MPIASTLRRRCVPGQRREGGWITLAELTKFCGPPRCLLGESGLGVLERGRELVSLSLAGGAYLVFCLRSQALTLTDLVNVLGAKGATPETRSDPDRTIQISSDCGPLLC